MTKQLQAIIERVKRWPAGRQQELARIIERLEESAIEKYELTDQERGLIDEGLASRVVSDDEMDKFWNRHRV